MIATIATCNIKRIAVKRIVSKTCVLLNSERFANTLTKFQMVRTSKPKEHASKKAFSIFDDNFFIVIVVFPVAFSLSSDLQTGGL